MGAETVTYQLTAQALADGINGLEVAVPSVFGRTVMFDVEAAIAAAVAAGGPANQLSVCDNALKAALDGCDRLYKGTAPFWLIDDGVARRMFQDSVDGGAAGTATFVAGADAGLAT